MIDEQVLVCPTVAALGDPAFSGLVTVRTALDALVTRVCSTACFRPRSLVETDPAWQQIIPYVVIRQGLGVVRYRRGVAGAEDRLHGLWSIGIGGHVNPIDHVDGPPEGPYFTHLRAVWRAVGRELDEEVLLPSVVWTWIVGAVRLTATPVDLVHLGIVIVLVAGPGRIAARDPALCDLTVVPVRRAVSDVQGYEGWAQAILESDLLTGDRRKRTDESGGGGNG